MSVGLPVRELTADAFRPYGRVIDRPSRKSDATGPGWYWWAETHALQADDRRWTIGYLELVPSDLRFDWAERHLRTAEAVVPTDGACLLYVGPPEHLEDPGRPPAFERFEVFRLRPGSGVIMNPGVWHGAPLADDGPAVAIVLLLEGTGRDDVTLVRFEDTPIEIDRTQED